MEKAKEAYCAICVKPTEVLYFVCPNCMKRYFEKPSDQEEDQEEEK